MPKKGRKLILVREDLLQRASRITAKEGKTMFAFTNRVFEDALRAHDMQTDLKEVLELHSIIMLGNDLGLAILPSKLLDYMVRKLHNSDRENLASEVHKSGTWFGKCLLIKFQKEEIIEILSKIMKKYMWHSLDLSIRDENERVELKCVSPTLSEEKTEVIFEFLLGVFEALGYELIEDNCFRGIIRMNFERAPTEYAQSLSGKLHVLQGSTPKQSSNHRTMREN